MAVTVSMEKGLTLTKTVSVKVLSHDLDSKTITAVLDGTFNVVVPLISGTDAEVSELINVTGLQMTVDGRISKKETKPRSEGTSPTRSGSNKYPDVSKRL